MSVDKDTVFDAKMHKKMEGDLEQFKSLFCVFITLISCNLSIQVL